MTNERAFADHLLTTFSGGQIERAARALSIEQGFTSGDAPILCGMRTVPVWQTRVAQVYAVLNVFEGDL